MKTFNFQALLGTVYRKGNVAFLPDGNTLLSPVGNRVTLYDMKRNEVNTLSVEASHNYTALDVSPNGTILLAGNEIGEVHIISLICFKLLNLMKVGDAPTVIRFSPDGKHFALAKRSNVFIYAAPSATETFNPKVMQRVFHDASSDVTCLDWSFDSKLVVVGSEDMSVRVYSYEKYVNFRHSTFTNHSDIIMKCFFEKSTYDLYSLSRNGQLCIWNCTELPEGFIKADNSAKEEIDPDDDETLTKEEVLMKKRKRIQLKPTKSSDAEADPVASSSTSMIRFKKENRLYYSDLFKNQKRPELSCADYNKATRVIVTGFSNGSFFIHELPAFTLIQSLSISDQTISTISLNCSGDWIAFGCPTLGQLLVWEWQSETYVLKQQGHFDVMNVCDYSSDGRHIATGGEDGKVKVWETRTSFCFVTFSDHTSSVTGVCFTQNGNAVISSSLDGTVRAFDLTRYRNFRTFTSPSPAQFSCVSVDSSREFVAAGAYDVFDIFIWSIKTGRLLEVLSGHEGPVPALCFTPSAGSTLLASVSWDKTFRVWETIETSGNREITQLNSEGTTIAFRPDGEEVAVGTLDCHVSFFDPKTSNQNGSIEGRNHLGSGRSDTDKITAAKSLQGKAFTTLAYSPDGTYLLAAGQSKTVCYYHAARQVLLAKYEITQNKSLDGMDEFVHHRKMTEFGNMTLLEDRDDDSADKLRLPGVKKGDMASRSFKPEVRVSCVRFSPTGKEFSATSTEGLLLYNQDTRRIFAPIDAGEEVTPDNIRSALDAGNYDKALILALHLNLEEYSREVFETVPISHIDAVCRAVPVQYQELLLRFLATEIGKTRHFEFCMMWIEKFLKAHLMSLKAQSQEIMGALNILEKNLTEKDEDLLRFLQHNSYLMEFLIEAGRLERGIENQDPNVKDEDMSEDEDDGGDSSESDSEDYLIRPI